MCIEQLLEAAFPGCCLGHIGESFEGFGNPYALHP